MAVLNEDTSTGLQNNSQICSVYITFYQGEGKGQGLFLSPWWGGDWGFREMSF